MSQPIYGFGGLAVRLAEAVGLRADNTLGFTIEVFPDEVIRVRSNQQATQDGIEEVARVFAQAKEDGMEPDVSRRPFIPVARLEDIRVRSAAGTLTNAERLALAVLAGGRDGEEGVPALIDAAQEEYSHGSYRVPVRVVAEGSRARIVIKPVTDFFRMPSSQRENLIRSVEQSMARWLRGESRAMLLPPGWSLDVYEWGADVPQVEVSLDNPDGD